MFSRSINENVLKEEGLYRRPGDDNAPVRTPYEHYRKTFSKKNIVYSDTSCSSSGSSSSSSSSRTSSSDGLSGPSSSFREVPEYGNYANIHKTTAISTSATSTLGVTSSNTRRSFDRGFGWEGSHTNSSMEENAGGKNLEGGKNDFSFSFTIPTLKKTGSSEVYAPPCFSSTTTANSPPPHKMTFWYNFIDPNHSRRLHPELPPKPVVDCSVPFNLLDETHQVRKFGVQKLGWDFLSMNEFVGAHEAVPYTESHHTWEILKLWLISMNVMQWNYFMARGQASGGIVGGGVRTRFAWNIAFFMSQLRMNLATMIGAGGYFYTYEYLYTHGPSCCRIRDPSPNAWKRPWDEGQSTYTSRAIASIFPALGYAFYAGRFKRSAFWFTMTLSTSLYYEYARVNILSGTRLFYSYLANQQADREAGFGSLAPRLKRRVDPDTNRAESAAQFKHYRITTGELQNTVWENAKLDNLPLHRAGMKLPNPYYNWKKAPQTYEKKRAKVKSDIWELPTVMSAKTLAFA